MFSFTLSLISEFANELHLPMLPNHLLHLLSLTLAICVFTDYTVHVFMSHIKTLPISQFMTAQDQ